MRSMGRGGSTSMVLLEICQYLAELVKDPDISKKVKEAYSLSEEEEAKYQEAQKFIASADAIGKDLKLKEDELKKAIAQYEANEAKSLELDAKEKEIAKELKRLEGMQASLDERAEKIEENEIALNARLDSINKLDDEIAQKYLELEEEREKFARAAAKSQEALKEIGF